MSSEVLASLRAQARAAAERAHVPFSGEEAGAALLLSDGAWVPGVRVESAAFSLTIPCALNAFTTAVAAGRQDVVAFAFSRPVRPVERAFWENGPTATPLRPASEDALAAEGDSLPALSEDALDPLLPDAPPASPADGVALARSVAERALVPASKFPVGCVLALAGGALVPGANVEPLADGDGTDWTRVLCAERSALGTAYSYGLLPDNSAEDGRAGSAPSSTGAPVLYLSCPQDDEGSPCGACRQLLVELLPGGELWMDRAPSAPEHTSPPALLPGSFRGSALSRHAPGA